MFNIAKETDVVLLHERIKRLEGLVDTLVTNGQVAYGKEFRTLPESDFVFSNYRYKSKPIRDVTLLILNYLGLEIKEEAAIDSRIVLVPVVKENNKHTNGDTT